MYKLAVFLVLAITTYARAQSTDTLSLITPESIAWISMQPQLLAKSKVLERAPLEVISAAGLEYFDLDPLKIERIDLISGVPIPGPGGVPVTLCVTNSEPFKPEWLQRYLPDGPRKEKGVELWPVPLAPDYAVGIRRERQAIIGPKLQVLRQMKGPTSDGEMRTLALKQKGNGAFQLMIAMGPIRELLLSNLELPQLQAIPELSPNLKVVLEHTRMLAMRIDTDKTISTTYTLEYEAADKSVAVNTALKNLANIAAQLYAKQLAQEMPPTAKTPAAILAYAKRVTEDIEKNFKFTYEDNRVSFKVEGREMAMAQTGILVGLLLPAVQAARQAAERVSGDNNMKQLLLAFHNYTDMNRTFPNNLGSDKKNKTANLSWRVHILPFLEQTALYNEFNLDEPWDSPHNIKLLESMPDVFKNPGSRLMPGFTIYQMPVGENMLLDADQRLSFSNVTDGTSNTIALFKSTDRAAVPWTKPADLDPIGNRAAIRTEGGWMTVGMLDASIRLVRDSIPEKALKIMLTINDGFLVDDQYWK